MRLGDADRVVGESAATFERFFADHLEVTLAVVVALRGPRVSAEELTQEAFERAYQRWDDLRDMERPDLWVQRVALNLATSQLRRLAAEARAVRRSGLRRPAVAETAEFDDAERFWQLVRRLPSQQARVVALHYAADRSVAEVAEVLGIAEGTVKAHLHKARARLTERLAQEDHRG